MWVDSSRADIRRLVKEALEEASRKNKPIETIDPVLRCARRLFPYLHEEAIYKYARTALRVIINQPQTQTMLNDHQTTLLPHILHP